MRDWRSFRAFSAFLVALFTEMYGFPLTNYFLSGWLQSNYPEIDWLAHDFRPYVILEGLTHCDGPYYARRPDDRLTCVNDVSATTN